MAWVVYLQMHEKQQEHHQPSMFLWKHGNRLEVYKNCCLNTNFYHLRQYSNKASPQLICQHLIYYTRQKKKKKMIIDTRDNSSGKCLTYIPNNVKKKTPTLLWKKKKGIHKKPWLQESKKTVLKKTRSRNLRYHQHFSVTVYFQNL